MLSRLLFLAGLAAFARSLLRYEEQNPERGRSLGPAPTNEFEQRFQALES